MTTMPCFENARVLIYGDVMLDRYWYGQTSRISPEAPVPVVHIQSDQSCAGGAANVALNVASLGARAALFGLVGQDSQADELAATVMQANIEPHLLKIPAFPTITKLRVIGQNQQLLRMDFEKGFIGIDDAALVLQFQQQLSTAQAVILSDYAKGTLHQVQQLIQLAKAKQLPVLIDPKSKDFNRYRGATLLTPNRKEFEAVVGVCENETQLIEKGQALLRQCDLQALLVTCGKDGMILLQRAQQPLILPAKAQEVFDVTGAGDTVIGVMAAAIAAGENFENAARLANTAAGLVVAKLGAATVSVPELRRALAQEQNAQTGVLSLAQLQLAVADARAHHETIVMTNGCFDILHSGHIQNLAQAKAMGDRLIVAVNDDASVSRLKGDQRPINPLADRMDVLAALRVVDWVVPFSEDTPARLIETILPNILVKGGDYRVDQIAGADVVIAHGGQVKILPLKSNRSSTRIINKMLME